ncbi:acetate/propionate family kinase [Marinobacter zhejiangensis]|uniref:Acetate kinase n=1 Tax=Marinobacter zhejiangensis TaxID=488535 RepID=A0A1I4P978_9GAMM|nr:acetate kinase [Marinobacter zhejiangensis]SFM24332.1 acetate kinase [Marinobacter zhejiangensis]
MDDPILVVNCGSSSLKIALFTCQDERLINILAENLSTPTARIRISGESGSTPVSGGGSHYEALNEIIGLLRQRGLIADAPAAIGHRVVHGGETFKEPSLIDAQVLDAIRSCSALAPLHNPVNLVGIEAAQQLFPGTPQVAVFDTAFHQTLPEHAYWYGVPQRYYRDWGVRRYGFHGTSHQFMAEEAARLLGKPVSETSLISAHLGNGCSITAIRDGKSTDTSMGLTPLEGLVMGTRSGDVDPGLFDFLSKKGLAIEEINRVLNRESGLLGLSGETNDMRTLAQLAEEGHAGARLAIEVFCFRLARYIGAMTASLSSLDALVFTGGIGENSALVRHKTLAHLSLLGLTLDEERNRGNGRLSECRIEGNASRYPVLVIPTNEELVIARAAVTHGLQNPT